MQDFYRCEEGYKARANKLAHQACYKLVKDMHYEARVHAVVVYCAEFEKRSVKKPAARDIFLMQDQYLRVNKCHLYSFILYLILQYVMYFIMFGCLRTGAQKGRVLVHDGGQVDQRGLGPPARLMPGAPLDDAGSSTSSGEP